MRCFSGLSALPVAAIAALWFLWGGVGHDPSFGSQQESTDKAVAAVAQRIQKAFNAHDASALSALWTEHAVHRSVSTGTELSGRPAIAEAYAAMFAHDAQCTLTIDVQSASVTSSNSAVITGITQVQHTGQPPTRSLFEARLTRVGLAWLVESVDETDLPLDAAAGLSPLAGLVGRWVEEQPGGRVVNEFRWVDGGAFLLRSYWSERKDAPHLQGTQILGWDAEQSCIRTWLFDSSGSFGEGYWQPEGASRWVNKLAIKLPDGRRAAVTQVVERTGTGHLTVQSIDREIDGEAYPNTPVARLVLQPATENDTSSRTDSKRGEMP